MCHACKACSNTELTLVRRVVFCFHPCLGFRRPWCACSLPTLWLALPLHLQQTCVNRRSACLQRLHHGGCCSTHPNQRSRSLLHIYFGATTTKVACPTRPSYSIDMSCASTLQRYLHPCKPNRSRQQNMGRRSSESAEMKIVSAIECC